MTSDKSQYNEFERIEELLDGSKFDDSVREDHQGELRVKVLQAFDRSQSDSPVVSPVVATTWKTKNWNATQTLGFVALIAVCLLGAVSLWFTWEGDWGGGQLPGFRPGINATIDPMFVASIAEVDVLRSEVRPEQFFDALAMCQQEHESRQLDADATEMRWLYESSHSTFPSESPKG